MVRGVTAGLFREKRELVELLNAMNQRVQAEEHPANKVLRKVASSGGERSVELLNKIAEWMEEKERVKRLSQVQPSPHSFPQLPALNPQMMWERAVPTETFAAARSSCRTMVPCSIMLQQLNLPFSAQMVSSLHGALEADAESGAMAPAANKQDSFAPPPSRPPALSKIFRVKQTTDALDVEVVAAASNVASLASTATSNDASFASTPTATSNDASFASGDVDVITDSAPPRHPRAFSKPSRKNPPPIQTELFIYTSDGGSSARSSASGWFGSFRSFRSVSSGTGAWFGRRLSV
ncbi:hypothetical protein T484DRAFT_1744954 [Baffinella frigidus]|nr:hypothetical protein T484DRAFT_1744954 [Cryptophyta sp. CCMP2293]